MKWNEGSCSEKHTCCNCIFWNLFWGRVGIYVFCLKILWSGFPQGSSEKFAISYQIKNEIFASNIPPLKPLVFSFNLLVKLMLAICEVCQRMYICMCVYCMYANILLMTHFNKDFCGSSPHLTVLGLGSPAEPSVYWKSSLSLILVSPEGLLNPREKGFSIPPCCPDRKQSQASLLLCSLRLLEREEGGD